ncbi:MAG: ATP-dependent DNA helicase [Nitrosomonas sp.]|nr:ATP-dependent DNA helicase [Nitrosomonas sp.]MBK7364821.1 ATP-dependent DNA helicase [Nitrosomonas sp.]
MSDLAAIFSAQGVLANTIPNYRARVQQLEMARAIAKTIQHQQILVAEAGTGTGKTFAYLVPALLFGGKVIISTGTKTLQDQLYSRDIPTIRAALKVPVTVALLKGRANYVCHYRLEQTLGSDQYKLTTREDIIYLGLIERFAQNHQTGDKSSLSKVPENAAIWQHVTSTRDNCLGSDCPNFKQCFVMEARKKALSSEVIVVNHHLFFADLMLRDEGLSELLPNCNTVIFDEAHQLPEVASLFFGESVSTNQLLELTRDSEIETRLAAQDYQPLLNGIETLEKATRDLRLTIEQDNARLSFNHALRSNHFSTALTLLQERLAELVNLLEHQAVRSQGLERCWKRATVIYSSLKRWQEQLEQDGYVRWVETFNQTLHLNATPLSIAETFSNQLSAPPRAWIFTSATLAVKDDFSHYQQAMGLTQAQSIRWESPYDFTHQALLYVPTGLPDPNHQRFTAALIEAILPVLKASQGRAFILCTSIRAMHEIHASLQTQLEQQQLTYPILCQGQGSRSTMLERFRELDNAILIGSQSFWEGVDVKGEALSVVIIDKLPFASPDDPILSARIDQLTREGHNAFMEYQLPRAIINLKQGAGRLIRDEHDRGVLMICDSRLITHSYGKRIWQSLPPMKRTRDILDVQEFFNPMPKQQIHP